jgi:hypothetical protein
MCVEDDPFISYSEQEGPEKVHTIVIGDLQFPPMIPPDKGCNRCQKTFEPKITELSIMRGRHELLLLIFPGVPEFSCECGSFVTNSVVIGMIQRRIDSIFRVIESNDIEKINSLIGLSKLDHQKLDDFMSNRWRPSNEDSH